VLIGVDLDNTIVCYDELLRAVALERGLIPDSVPASKGAVRDWLRRAGLEDRWTELQGYAYGARMHEAQPFPGALEFFARCRESQIPVFIISHRTRYPYLGEKYDLHQAARAWLAMHGFCDPDRIGLEADRLCLELTKQDKLARIASAGCSHFIDDLPEFLEEPAFPAGVQRVLFDPGGLHRDCSTARRAANWAAIERLLFSKES
jgi:hypothetical protein